MRIIRYQDQSGTPRYGCCHTDGSVTELEGDLFDEFRDSRRSATVVKLLAPIMPTSLLCIGLNYRRHAEEGRLPIPEHPVLFMKSVAAVQNPGDPILLPRQPAQRRG